MTARIVQPASADVLFILLGAIMVLAMHAGFAFLELGTVRKKNQVNALVKILVDFAVSTVAYFFVGYAIAYGASFFTGAEQLARRTATSWSSSSSCSPSPPPSRPSSRAASPSARASARSSPPPRCSSASSIRCSRASPGTSLRHPGLDQGTRAPSSTTSPAPSSCTRWAAGSALAAVLLLGARSEPLPQGRRDLRPPAVQHPVPRARRLGAHRRLVRLQRDERADHRQDLGPGRGQLADGDGGRHAGGGAARAATTRASCTTARSPGWSRSARAAT